MKQKSLNIAKVSSYWELRIYEYDQDGEHTNNCRVQTLDLDVAIKIAIKFMEYKEE